MAATSSLVLKPKAKTCRSKICKACGLYVNQEPIYDERRAADVFWVGLSAVKFSDDEEKLPLSPLTPSGALIHRIEQEYKSHLTFYKTNLVKCVPLKEDRIRYPMEHEMEKCFPHFEEELDLLRLSTVFLLGKQVATFVLKKLSGRKPSLNEEFEYSAFNIDGINFIPIHHPSFMLVYKRKELDKYSRNIQRLFPTEWHTSMNEHHTALYC
jgi:DNA polymerase